MSENKICDALDHRWLEEYYGYKCENCGSFVPYGCEPWVGDEAAQQSFAADTPSGYSVKSSMQKGYHFDMKQCPHCNQLVKENWLVKHIKSGCKVPVKKS